MKKARMLLVAASMLMLVSTANATTKPVERSWASTMWNGIVLAVSAQEAAMKASVKYVANQIYEVVMSGGGGANGTSGTP